MTEKLEAIVEDPKPKPVVPQVELKVEPEVKLEAEPKLEPEPKPEPKPPVEDWRDKRIPQLTAQKRELEAEVARLKAAQANPEPNAEVEARITAEASRRAGEIAAMQKFSDDCRQAADKGKVLFPDFEQKITSLAKLIDVSSPESLQRYQQFVAAALETGEAPRLLHALGGDLNEAERIMSLPPTKQGIELAKLALKPQPEGGISKLSKPITPLGNRGAQHTDIDPSDAERGTKLDVKTWMERRNLQAAEAAKQHRGY